MSTPSGVRLSSVALALALLFALGGLYSIDRTLSASSRTQVQSEAIESSALAESFLLVHAEVLHSVRGILVEPVRHVEVEEEQFNGLVTSMAQYAPAFRSVWVADSMSVVRYQFLFGPQASVVPAGVRLDTLVMLDARALVEHARATGRTQVAEWVSGHGDQEIVILDPLFIDGRLVGFAGATLPAQALLAAVESRRPHVAGRLAILAGNDTIGAVTRPTGGRVPAYGRAALRIPGGSEWLVVVARATRYETVRLLVWGVGLATLAALIVALLHERRQGLRLAGRSLELERLSSELLRANRTKSEFLASISHELRTPLNAIVGFVELLRDGVYGELSPRQSGPVDRIASSANHLRQLVDQLLDLAKMAAGRLEVHAEVIDVRPVVLEAVAEMEPLVRERGLGLDLDVTPGLPRLRTDPMHLRQILLNLLSNAVKFTPAGAIAVRTRLVDAREHPVVDRQASVPRAGSDSVQGWIAVRIADSGVGIASADRDRIFNEFEQVSAGPRGESARRGTGLGLPISRRLARLLGGDLSVESEVGQGSTFTLWLPVDADELKRVATGERAVTSPGLPIAPAPVGSA